MAEEKVNNQDVVSKRALLRERLSKKYPGEDFSDDEAVASRISADYDDYEGMQERERTLNEMFKNDPRSATFLNEWREGGNPVVALVRTYGDTFRDALEDEAMQEELAKANQEWLDRVAKEGQLEEEYNKNLQASLELIDRMGLPEQEVDDVVGQLVQIANDVIMGKFTEAAINLVRKGVKHDEDVAVAGHEGEVRGRNANIKEKLLKGRQGDGMARLGSASAAAPQPKQARRMRGDDIWNAPEVRSGRKS